MGTSPSSTVTVTVTGTGLDPSEWGSFVPDVVDLHLVVGHRQPVLGNHN